MRPVAIFHARDDKFYGQRLNPCLLNNPWKGITTNSKRKRWTLNPCNVRAPTKNILEIAYILHLEWMLCYISAAEIIVFQPNLRLKREIINFLSLLSQRNDQLPLILIFRCREEQLPQLIKTLFFCLSCYFHCSHVEILSILSPIIGTSFQGN